MTDRATRRAYRAGQWVQFVVAWLLVLTVATVVIAAAYGLVVFVRSAWG